MTDWWEKHSLTCASRLPMYAVESACDCGALEKIPNGELAARLREQSEAFRDDSPFGEDLRNAAAILEYQDEQLNNLADYFQYWIDFATQNREKEGLDTVDETHIIVPPMWPHIGQVKHWIAVLRKESPWRST